MVEPIFYPSESTVAPKVIEFGDTTVYIRKDIEKRTDNENDIWSYQEAQFSKDEFADYYNSVLYTNELKQEEERLIIMEAIADIFDAVSAPTIED